MKMTFGVHLPLHGRYAYVDVEKVTVLAERLGFRSLWAGDHFFLPAQSYERLGTDATRPDKLEAWPVLAALAARTRRITLGTRVSPIPFYLPGRLAKIVATVDIISNGRAVLGVGAGWHREEAVAFGLPWRPLETRIDQMFEGLEIIMKLWTEERTAFKGRHYQVKDAPCFPKPVQKPTPPVFFGGNAPRILDAAGRMRQGWLPLTDTPIDELRSRTARIWAAASEAAKDREAITVAASLSYPAGTGARPEDWVTKVQELASLGVAQTILDLSQTSLPPDDGLDLLEKLADHVLPAYA